VELDSLSICTLMCMLLCVVCEETTFQVLKLFGVGVTAKVRHDSLKKPVESNDCIACHRGQYVSFPGNVTCVFS
jgi:hypothetical protein